MAQKNTEIEKTDKASLSGGKKIALFVILLALSGGLAVLYTKDKLAQDQTLEIINTITPTPKVVEEVPVVSEPVIETIEPEQIVVEPVIEIEPIIIEPVVVEEVKPIMPEPEFIPVPQRSEMEKALALRDDFLMGRDCFSSYNIVINTAKSKAIPNVIEKVAAFCVNGNNTYKELEKNFTSNRKKALSVMYRESNTSWMGRVQSMTVQIIQIRDLNPKGIKPRNLLDRAHNALDNREIEESVVILEKLPPKTLNEMTPYIQSAEDFIEAKHALDQLILSYKGK